MCAPGRVAMIASEATHNDYTIGKYKKIIRRNIPYDPGKIPGTSIISIISREYQSKSQYLP